MRPIANVRNDGMLSLILGYKKTVVSFLGTPLPPPSNFLKIVLVVLGFTFGMLYLSCSSLWCISFSLVLAVGFICPVACGILVPQPGIEPLSPALEDGFLTTGTLGKSHSTLARSLPFTLSYYPHRSHTLEESGHHVMTTLKWCIERSI